ncbi:hypothetical protein AA313_de0200817 [Arthrobotrys entomopaga]|nr:hypothetical protein AA313_de0200817 [Arthrobotrys entomopaga]
MAGGSMFSAAYSSISFASSSAIAASASSIVDMSRGNLGGSHSFECLFAKALANAALASASPRLPFRHSRSTPEFSIGGSVGGDVNAGYPDMARRRAWLLKIWSPTSRSCLQRIFASAS